MGAGLWAEPVALTVWMKQCSLSSSAYSTLSLMNTEIALSMNDTNRFMWMKLRVQCSFLQRSIAMSRTAAPLPRERAPGEATSTLGKFHLVKVILPEPAQDDHGDGEGDQRGAVAHRVQSLHRHVVHALEDTSNKCSSGRPRGGGASGGH